MLLCGFQTIFAFCVFVEAEASIVAVGTVQVSKEGTPEAGTGLLKFSKIVTELSFSHAFCAFFIFKL